MEHNLIESQTNQRVRVTLVAYKRLECSCIIELLADEDASEGDELQKALRDVVDESCYVEDLDYWKDAGERVERAGPDDDEPASFHAVSNNAAWRLVRVRA